MLNIDTSAPATNAHLTTDHLTERALLVGLNIREWGARRRDRDVTDHVAREHGADPKAGCYTKALVPKRFLAKIASVRTEARNLHHQLTLPWGDDGYRILPVELHLKYMDNFRVLRSRFEQAVSEFLGAYEEAKAAARESLGSLFREDDYPSSSRLRRAFDFEVKPQPLPTGHDWRIDLPEDTVDRIREELAGRLEDAHRQGLSELHRRLAGVVSRMAETLAQPDKIFRDSLVGNVRQLCNLLPALNLAQDTGLDSLNREIEIRLATLEPEVLRTDPQRRQAAALDAAALLSTITDRLASYTGSTI
jgi:hypothetical protein